MAENWDRFKYEGLSDAENATIAEARRRGYAVFFPSFPNDEAQAKNTLKGAKKYLETAKSTRKLYVASRASVPERPAMWRRLRDVEDWPIVSTWIDEAGEGETDDFAELWARIEDEIRQSDGLILYAEPGDFPLKGALVEVGIAIGLGRRVAVVLSDFSTLEPRSMRPLGSWAKHPLCGLFTSVYEAKSWIDDPAF